MYKVVIGLEVHCELKTESKSFSGAKNEITNEPNKNIAVVDIGYPGILPLVNEEAVKKALKTAIALHCELPDELLFDRKNYFYPDLPKGYQITQMTKPMGKNGYLMIHTKDGDKKIDIHQLHLEEDTANLEHMINYSLINYNRCGVPLMEIVTEPVMNSVEEAIAFLDALKAVFIYCDVSDAKAELGQIRCDVNVSLMEKDATELGTRVEMKNVNTFNNVKGAIESEIKRQTELLEKGEKIVQETRRYDDATMKTYPMREKVDAIDYRYFVEPNIAPIILTEEWKEQIKKEIPMLQYDRIKKYVEEYTITRKDANILVKTKEVADYFEECVKEKGDPQTISNWLNGTILNYLNKENKKINEIYLQPRMLVNLTNAVIENKISSKQAREVLARTLEEKRDPMEIIETEGIKQVGSEEELRMMAIEILEEHPELIEQHRSGRNVFDFFVGQIMKKTKGQANPALATKILKEEIEKR